MFDCILLMAGKGLRTKLDYNKTLYVVNNQPLYMFSLKEFLKLNECKKVILVTSLEDFQVVKNEIEYLKDSRIYITIGGITRQESVHNGMKLVNSEVCLIHDAARPFVRKEDILKVYEATKTYGAAALGVSLKDSIKIVDNGFVIKTIDRNILTLMQTPQGIQTNIFRNCLNEAQINNYVGTDDIELVEKFSNVQIKLIEGSDKNIKITTPQDLKILDSVIGE